jgi:predicted peptidase
LHLLGQVGKDKAKARVQELAVVYGDYQPSFVGFAPGYEEVVEAGRRHTKKVPKEVAEVRRKARAAKNKAAIVLTEAGVSL